MTIDKAKLAALEGVAESDLEGEPEAPATEAPPTPDEPRNAIGETRAENRERFWREQRAFDAIDNGRFKLIGGGAVIYGRPRRIGL